MNRASAERARLINAVAASRRRIAWAAEAGKRNDARLVWLAAELAKAEAALAALDALVAAKAGAER